MTTTQRKPKVIIGIDYRPTRFERRTINAYSALQPEPSHDAIEIQRAITRAPMATINGHVDPERIVGYGIAICAGILVVLTAFGVIA